MRINRIPLKKTRKDQVKTSMKMVKELKDLRTKVIQDDSKNQPLKTAKTIDMNNSPQVEPRSDILMKIEKDLGTAEIVTSPIRLTNRDLS